MPVLLPALPFHPLLLRARWLLIFLVQLSEGFLQQQNDVTLGGIKESSYDSTVQDFFFLMMQIIGTQHRPTNDLAVQSAGYDIVSNQLGSRTCMACDLAYKGAAAGTQKDEVFW